ncbi:MAG: preprotein translocase subunit YajC [Actinomycetota bacterium]|nr:preprotein translocase subunit YajC [Actinomycetota bacterium]
MPLSFPALAHVAALSGGVLAAASSKKPTTSGSPVIFILLIVVVGAYFLFIAPQRRKMKAQMSQQNQFEVDDEVVTKSGIYGTVRGKDGDRIQIEIAPGTVIEVMNQAIARRVDPVVAPEADESDEASDAVEADEAPAGGVAWQSAQDSDHWTEPAHEGLASSNGSTPEPVRSGDEPLSGGQA